MIYHIIPRKTKQFNDTLNLSLTVPGALQRTYGNGPRSLDSSVDTWLDPAKITTGMAAEND